MVFFSGVPEVIENDSGLDAGDAFCRVDLEDLSHVLGEVEDDRNIAALSGERGSATTAEQRSAELTADRNGGFDVVGIAWENYTDGNLAVVGTVGGVKGAAAVVETDIAADAFSECFMQPQGIRQG
jgi:hypothetical protein